jgi:CRP-like cAMP-binding protein
MYLDRLDDVDAVPWELPEDAVAAMRALAALDLVPELYDWLADDAAREDVVAFLSLEGGPDGGFDDLVAACQIGLAGEAKVELAQNYWDEMGNGELAAVHTELHRSLVSALGLVGVPRTEQPIEALERSVLGTLLATNRHLQPEMVGALGLVELQAGPRCRRVVTALRRIDAPAAALPFYEEHAVADPRHGKDWLDHVIVPLAADPSWAAGMLRGARWRSSVNRRFLSALGDRFATGRLAARRAAAPARRCERWPCARASWS